MHRGGGLDLIAKSCEPKTRPLQAGGDGLGCCGSRSGPWEKHMRMRWMVGCLLLLSPHFSMAQSASTLVGPSATVPASAQLDDSGPRENAYMIAPGVVVTSFYQGAPKEVPAYDPNTAAGNYSSQAYQGSNAPSYVANTGAILLPSAQPAAYQQAYPVPQGSGAAYGNPNYRFYMQQNGKQMSARDFDAWMAARGIRVVGSHR